MLSAHQRWSLAVAAALSGAGALLFEVLWGRGLALVLGSTAEANAAVFAAFLTAMTIGAAIAGATIDRVQRPRQVYLVVELIAGVTPALAALAVTAWAPQIADEFGGLDNLLVSYLLALLVMGVPVTLVGASFPVLMAILGRASGEPSRLVSRLYGANVIGGAVGAVSAVFLFVNAWGIPGACAAGFLLHSLGGIGVFVITGRVSGQSSSGEAAPREASLAGIPLRLAMLVGLFGGAAALSTEVVWTRLGTFIAGGRMQAMALVLGATLVSLGLGSWLASYVRRWFGRHALMIALGIVPFAMIASTGSGWWVAKHREGIEAALPAFTQLAVGWRFLEVLLPIAIALVPLGVLYPLAVNLCESMDERAGWTTGWITAANTAGAATGALLTVFIGFEYLGMFATFDVVVAAAMAIWSLFVVTLYSDRRALSGASVALAAVMVWAVFYGPNASPVIDREDEEVLAVEEDRTGITKIGELDDGAIRVMLNRTRLVWYYGRLVTTRAQQDQAHIPMAYVPQAERALVIGAGYGITAGTLAEYEIDHLDVIDPYAALFREADRFAAGNFGYAERDNVELRVGDGRHLVSRSDDPDYDVVSINITDPTLPASAAVMRSDFYSDLKDRLSPGGVVLQQAFRKPDVVLATLRDSFEHVRIYRSYSSCACYNAIASDQPLQFDRSAWLEQVRSASMNEVRERYDLSSWTQLAAKIEERWTSPARHPGYFEGPVASDLFPRLLFGWDTGAAMLEKS